jgi:membrane protein
MLASAMDSFSEDRCWTFSAAISYYTVFSLPWILLIVVHIAGWIVGNQAAVGEIHNRIQSVAGSAVAQQIETMLQNASQPGGHGLLADLIGIAVIIVSSTSAFAEFQFALNQAWEVEPGNSWRAFAVKRLISFLMVVGIGIILIALMALRTVLSTIGLATSFPFSEFWQMLLAWIALTVLVGAIFRVLPDARIAWQDVGASAVLTATLLTLSKYGMSVYLAHSSVATSFGAAGSLAIILLWLYTSSLILLFGAEFARAWSRFHGRDVVPEKGAVRVAIEKRAA